MARPLTVAQIISRIRWKSGQDKSLFIAEDEILAYVDSAACELYDLLVLNFKDYYIDYADFTTVQDQNVYTLPANFLKLRGIDLIKDNKTIKLEAFPFEERERYVNATPQAYPFNIMKYCILGNTLLLAPQPNAGLSIRLWYVPALPLITSASQSLSTFSGWEELIIATVCADIAIKAEESPTPFINKKNEMIRRIEEAGQQRDTSGSGVVSDTAGTNDSYNIFPYHYTGV